MSTFKSCKSSEHGTRSRNHPFVDGNKRTAVAAAGLLLRRNGFALVATQEELYAFTMVMATGEAGQAEAREWLAAHAVRA